MEVAAFGKDAFLHRLILQFKKNIYYMVVFGNTCTNSFNIPVSIVEICQRII